MDGDQQRAGPTGNGSATGGPAAQFAMLDYLFPGLSVFTSAASAYLGRDVSSSFLPLLLAVLAAGVVWNHVRESVRGLVDAYLMSSVSIRTDDEVYNMVMLWLSKQGFSRRSRHVVANTDITSRNRYMYRYSDSDSDSDHDDDDDDDAAAAAAAAPGLKSKPLHYTPAFGSHLFWYKGQPLFFERHKDREHVSLQVASEREELSLWCFGRSPRILKELLLDARQMHMTKDERKTLIYRGNLMENYWQRCMSRLNRPFSTVILNERVKQDLLADAADYLDPATRRWYANRGIPYRRGYLLHGPPGTGKSSLSLALAGYFRIKIYIVSLSSTAATEENITTLFHELPTRCIVLLEDIDSAGLTHTRDDGSASPGPAPASSSPPAPEAAVPAAAQARAAHGPTPPAPVVGGRLSLSGLLNILDGVASQEGRILIMTTNHVEKLDKALIRPGRVDMVIPFGLADADMISAIFGAIYAPFDSEAVPRRRSRQPSKGASGIDGRGSGSASDDSDVEEERAAVRKRIEGLAKSFAARMPECEFSPAEVQGLLLRHKRSPEAAIAAVDDWVAKMRKDKEEQAARALNEPPVKADEPSSSSSESSESEQGELTDRRKSRGADDSKRSTSAGVTDGEAEFKASEAVRRTADDKASVAGAKPKSASDSGYDTP